MNFHRLFSFCAFLSLTLSLSLPLLSAHNWPTFGRADVATTEFPCLPRVNPDPDIQVGPNQLFQLFWSGGHGNNCYLGYTCPNPVVFVVVKASDIGNIPRGSAFDTMVNDYQAYANAHGIPYLTGDTWVRRHLTPKYSNPNQYDGSYFDYFTGNGPMFANDSQYISLDPAIFIRGKSNFMGYKNNMEWRFDPLKISTDWRLEYSNPKYPFIESIHWFDIIEAQSNLYAGQYDFSNFRIPARHGSGEYIIFYNWEGYYECVDVDVQPQPVGLPYGTVVPNATSSSIYFLRVDHTEFAELWNPATPCRRVDHTTMDISQCLADCRNNPACDGVQVTRMTNPSISLPRLPNIPFTKWNSLSYNLLVGYPCNYSTPAERQQHGCKMVQPMCNATAMSGPMGIANDDYVCFGSSIVINQQLQATQPYSVSEDPLDPRFFSTLYFKAGASGFSVPPPRPSTPKPSWRAGDYGVSCSYINYVQSIPENIAPNWENGLITNGPIQNCDNPVKN